MAVPIRLRPFITSKFDHWHEQNTKLLKASRRLAYALWAVGILSIPVLTAFASEHDDDMSGFGFIAGILVLVVCWFAGVFVKTLGFAVVTMFKMTREAEQRREMEQAEARAARGDTQDDGHDTHDVDDA